MHKNAVRRLSGVVALAIGAVAGGIAHAQTTNVPVGATCSGGGQLCNNIDSVPVETTGVLQAQFVSDSPGTCSSVRIHFLVDGNEVAVTGFVGPGGSSGFFNLGPVGSGNHTLGLQAEGQVGGCNSGTLGSWAGTAQVTTSGELTASQPVPTLSQWALVALVAVIGAFAALRMRRA